MPGLIVGMLFGGGYIPLNAMSLRFLTEKRSSPIRLIGYILMMILRWSLR